ncbi:MAG: dual specificity protein phosphatase family protein [Actinobacteria bacterium]|nr:dual specificity protein phosphatase family protein [Actinomycetota bacterium]
MHTDLPTAEFANIHFVTPQLAFGGDLSPHDAELSGQQFAEIGKLGITHVVDVRIEWSDEQTFAEQAPHVRYLHHGMDDAGQSVPPEWFEQAVSWIEAAWAEDPDAVVLAHCHMGINRGPSLAFAVLLALGWEPVEAINALRSARSQANVWYAADALTWHHQRAGTDAQTAAEQHAALAAWREDNPLDVVRLIREVRDEEDPF